MAAVEDVLRTRLEMIGLNSYLGGFSQMADAAGLLERKLSDAQKKQLSFGIASMAASAGLTAGIGATVVAAGGLEQVQIGLEGALGSVDAAQSKIKELQDLAIRSPFRLAGLASDAQTLLGMGAAAEDVIPILTALGNAAAAAGRGEQSFHQAVLAVSQIISKGKLQGDELIQLAEAGVPLKGVLDELGTTMGEVGSKGITSAQVIAALTKVMGEGRFAGAMERQSRSLKGSISSLMDAREQLEQSFGAPLVGPVTAITRGITALTLAVNSAPGPVKVLASAAGVILAGGLGVAGLAMTVATAYGKVLTAQLGLLALKHREAATAATQHAAAESVLARTALPTGGILPGVPPLSDRGKELAQRAGRGGLLAGGALLGGHLGLSLLPDTGSGGVVKDVLGGAVNGASLGMLAGLVNPALAIPGGAIGAVLGSVVAAADGVPQPQAPGAQAEQQERNDLLKRQVELQQQQVDELKGIRSAFPTNLVPGGMQAMAMVRALA